MPEDYGTRYTEARVKETARRLRRVYEQAAKEIDEKTKGFWKRHEAKSDIYLKKVEKGELKKSDYDAWMRGQVFQGEQWAAKKEQITKTLVNADKIAQEIINGQKKDVFAANANYIGYDLERQAGVDLGFGLYDSSTVARLIKDEPDLLPAIRPDKVVVGEDTQWYQKMVTTSVTQGIIQGEGIKDIFNRITETCTERAESAAMRDARTAYTGAQNAGRVEGMRQMQVLGVQVRKKWMATFDFKTRDTHRALDGQTAEVDEPFITINGDAIMYPGDPHAKASDLYNCRCTLVDDFPEFPSSIERRDNTTGEDVGNMTYKQWEKWKTGFTNSEKSSIIKEVRSALAATKSTANNAKLYQTTEAIQSFTGVDDAVKYFQYEDEWGDIESPIDKESFEGIRLPVLKEVSEGLHWAQTNYNLGSKMPHLIQRKALKTGVYGEYSDVHGVISLSKGLREEYAFSTSVHEMTHHADRIYGFPSNDIVNDVCKKMKNNYSISEIQKMRWELAGKKWNDSHVILAYSLEKVALKKGNALAQEVANEFMKRCGKP